MKKSNYLKSVLLAAGLASFACQVNAEVFPAESCPAAKEIVCKKNLSGSLIWTYASVTKGYNPWPITYTPCKVEDASPKNTSANLSRSNAPNCTYSADGTKLFLSRDAYRGICTVQFLSGDWDNKKNCASGEHCRWQFTCEPKKEEEYKNINDN